MTQLQERGNNRVLGVIAHHLLRVRAVVEMREEARVAVFAPPDSPLLEVADVPCPVRSLDLTVEEFDRAVEEVVTRRGVDLGGILSIRDGNVYGAASACHNRGMPSLALAVLDHVRTKSAFRAWLDQHGNSIGCRVIPWQPVPKDMTYDVFCAEMCALHRTIVGGASAGRAQLILKPDAGSCSQLIVRIDSVAPADLERAWQVVQRGRGFRNGHFLAEEAVVGREVAVDTISTPTLQQTFLTGYLPLDPGTFYTVGAVVPAFPQLSPSEDQSARTVVERVHSVLGLEPAVTHTEVILPADGSKPVIVELNPRMGGGVLQEMHRLVSGVQMNRIAARLALGSTDIADLLGGGSGNSSVAKQVLIRFRRPGGGRMTVGSGAPCLRHPFERFRFLQPISADLKGGLSDDDLLAWCLIGAVPEEFGTPQESFDSLLSRANDLMFGWLPEAH